MALGGERGGGVLDVVLCLPSFDTVRKWLWSAFICGGLQLLHSVNAQYPLDRSCLCFDLIFTYRYLAYLST
ncbi:hypothetical protein F4775DRAFT_571125 [Biscogniauxia sp. FL1348]|nr:hypothetical protein F4775DRAFT_571125 [Biscogniauxia sp. FL1348]